MRRADQYSLGEDIQRFFSSASEYCLLQGLSEDILRLVPENSVDCCITSPPYWSKRRYEGDSSLGNEKNWRDFVRDLAGIFEEVKRVLKPTGSLWLNIGDTYVSKALPGIPWRVAFSLQENGWILRNSVVWDKVKGNPCNSKDKLRNVHEYVFHFVLQNQYYYDVDAIRNAPKKPYYREGRIVTPTGVSGTKYEKQIKDSKELSINEKQVALATLEATLRRVERGEIQDFRMIVRGAQRATHSDSLEYSGRANELKTKGFCILPYHKNGTKPADVWRIIPEDSWRKDPHFAVFPIELCETPVKATCSPKGVVLDPFVGTGTSVVAANALDRRGIGIDASEGYLREAKKRVEEASRLRGIQTAQDGLF